MSPEDVFVSVEPVKRTREPEHTFDRIHHAPFFHRFVTGLPSGLATRMPFVLGSHFGTGVGGHESKTCIRKSTLRPNESGQPAFFTDLEEHVRRRPGWPFSIRHTNDTTQNGVRTTADFLGELTALFVTDEIPGGADQKL